MAGLRISSESGASRIGLDKVCEEREELIYGGEKGTYVHEYSREGQGWRY